MSISLDLKYDKSTLWLDPYKGVERRDVWVIQTNKQYYKNSPNAFDWQITKLTRRSSLQIREMSSFSLKFLRVFPTLEMSLSR